MLKRTNIEAELAQLKSKRQDQQAILEQVYQFLGQDKDRFGRIGATLGNGEPQDVFNRFDFDLLETERIFHIEQIKQICVDYRLRFLGSKYFKGALPQEAIAKIDLLEQLHDAEIKGFHIMAPSRLFKLEDKDDPLLFAPIGNNYFYLVHKWGNDLHPFRRMFAWPFKNIVNLTFLVFAFSFLVALLVPTGLFSKTSSNAEFFIVFLFIFKCLASVVIFYGFAMGKNFNTAIWNSKYFNV